MALYDQDYSKQMMLQQMAQAPTPSAKYGYAQLMGTLGGSTSATVSNALSSISSTTATWTAPVPGQWDIQKYTDSGWTDAYIDTKIDKYVMDAMPMQYAQSTRKKYHFYRLNERVEIEEGAELKNSIDRLRLKAALWLNN